MNDARLEFLGAITAEERARYMRILEATRVRIVADNAASRQRDVQIAAQRGADVIARLFDHVRVEIEAPWAESVNRSLISRSTPSVEVEREITVALGDTAGDVHLGYQNGTLLVARAERQRCASSDPAALLAGPVIAAEVFKLCFEPYIRAIVRSDYALPIGLTKAARALVEGEIPISLLIAGGGSVGFAFVDALVNLGVGIRGNIALVDNGTLEERNAVKYAALDLPTARSCARKTEVLKRRLAAAFPDVAVQAHNGTIETYAGAPAEIVVISMDNVAARRAAQEALSRDIVNLAVKETQLEVASLTFGQTGCVYCYYRDNPEESQDYSVVAEHFGLELSRVELLMTKNEPLTSDDINRCAKRLGISIEQLRGFMGQPLRSMIPRLYAQAEARTAGGSVYITTAFVSAMAGALGALEMLKAAKPEFRSDRRSVAMDMLGIFHDLSLREIPKRADCAICNNKFRRSEYARLWPGSICA